MSLPIIKGTIVSAPALGRLEITPGGYLASEEGRITGVGPVLPERSAPAARGDRPLIYVSLGTVMNRNARFYRNCAEALGGGPWDVLMSVGSGERAASLGALPPNVRAEARVDQLRVLQAAHLFVTHCGMNSVSESIWQGVPMVLSPQQSEERMVARRAAELGMKVLGKHFKPAGVA